MSATRAASTSPRNPNPLKTFVWVGVDKRGTKMKGESLSKNASLLKAELRKQGITPSVVKPKPKPLFGAAGKPIKPADIAVFSRQIATMMKAGVPLVTAIEIIAGGQKNPRMKNMLDDIRASVEGGSTLHEALGKHPMQFDDLYLNLVKAGEGAGVLDTVLETIADYKEKTEALKSKIKKALFYPAMVIAVAIIVTSILMIFVIPQFEEVFRSFGADLPAFTMMLVSMSKFMTTWWPLIAVVTVGGIIGLIQLHKRSRAVAHFVDRAILKIPVIGDIMRNSAIARFSRTLAITFRAGVPLVEALDIVGGATGNIVYEQAVHRVRDDVAVGYQLNTAMRQVDVFPHMVIQMAAIGEEAGALDTMLIKVAEFYEQEVDNAVDALTSLLEPMIMVIIGTIVGGIVIGMYLPIFKLGAAI